MADLPTSQYPGQPSTQVTHNPEIGDGATLVVVTVAALAFGLLKDIIHLLIFLRLFNFASDSKPDLSHAVSRVFTSKISVARPFRVVHEAKASHYIFKHPYIYYYLLLLKIPSRLSSF